MGITSMRTKLLPVAVAALFVGAGLTFGAGRTDETAQPASMPRYNPAGELLRPEGYRTWVFVGADLGLDYSQRNDQSLDYPKKKDEKAEDESRPFHNVYIDRKAYDHYARTGEFPDKTMLVLELFESRRKEPQHIVTRGQFEGNRVALEVAVKDLSRPDGSKTPWGYYDFTGKAGPAGREVRESARAKPDGSCYDCHKKHADVDNVWVQFYPTLRDLTKTH
jgi:Cytochrome P460